MAKRINITEYPVEYAPFNPSVDECFYGGVENTDLPDSRIASMHYHSSYQIGVCLEGNGVFLIKDGIYAVKKGDAVIIAPDEIHCSRGIKDEKCTWDFIYFDPFEMKNRYPELFLPESEIVTEEESELNGYLRKIVEEGRRPKDVTANRLASLYFYTFSLLQYRRGRRTDVLSDPSPDSFESPDLYSVMPAMREIAFRFDESVSVAELSGICRLSPSHFTRLFKKCLGTSPYEYTLKFRATVGAALLLSSDRSVNDISEVVGFNSGSDFYRQFIKYYSVSPSEYRAAHTPERKK